MYVKVTVECSQPGWGEQSAWLCHPDLATSTKPFIHSSGHHEAEALSLSPKQTTNKSALPKAGLENLAFEL